MLSASSSPQRFPEFYVVGHPKSGTTALHQMLRQHPQIFMPPSKEPAFFSTDIIPCRLAEDEYLALFDDARPGQIRGETSVWYLASEVAAAGIASKRPDAKVVLLIREPVAFLRSLHLQNFKERMEPEIDFARALALEGERSRDPRIANGSEWRRMRVARLHYSTHVNYTEQIARFRRALSPQNVDVVVYQDFRHDNIGTLHEIHRFLGVDEFEVKPEEANESASPRTVRLARVVNEIRLGRGRLPRSLHHAIKRVTTQQMRDAMLARSRDVVRSSGPASDPVLEAELKRRFAPEVQRISEYLNRDLVHEWGYEQFVSTAV